MNQASSGNLFILLILGLAVAIWGVLGWMDLENQTQLGYDTDGNNTVIQVYAGSPAEGVGLLPGDYIKFINGVSTEDAATLARQPRLEKGAERAYTIERDGEEITMIMRFGPLLDRTISLARAATIIGFCFLIFPLLAYFSNQSAATRVLALMGIGLGLAFMGGPYIAAFAIRSLTSAIANLFVLIGVGALLHFLLLFPHPRAFLDRFFGKKLVYFPAFALWVLIAYRVMFTPPATSALNTMTTVVAGVVIGGYFLISLFVMLRNYSRTNAQERKALSLNTMLWGSVVGLMPVTVAQLVSAASPQTVLPGQDYYFVTLALIPMTWALSASKS
jgi:hypothetical protein